MNSTPAAASSSSLPTSSSSSSSTSMPAPTSAATPAPSTATSASTSTAASASSASASIPAPTPTYGPITTVVVGNDTVNLKSPLWKAIGAADPDLPLARQLIADGGTLTPREWEVLTQHANVEGLATAFECGLRPDDKAMRMMLQIAGGYDETALPDPEAARDMCAILLPHNTSTDDALAAISCARSRFAVEYNTPREEWPDHLRMLVDWCHDHDVPEKHIQWVERDVAGIPQPDPEFD